MKKWIWIITLLAMGAGGTGWMARRRRGTPPPDVAVAPFTTEASGQGVRLHYGDTQLPLRTIRWLNASPGAIQVAQVVTQNDRQQIAWFEHGLLKGTHIVPKPQGVREGFFAFAELVDACVWPGDVAVLLYRAPEASSDEVPLVLALDLSTQAIRWIHRAPGLRLVPTPSATDGAVYLIGPRDPITRLPLASLRNEQVNLRGIRNSAKSIELPPEIQEVGTLLPTGTWTFLVAHREGLSAYLGVKGWTHQSLPEIPPIPFENGGPSLVHAKNLWWQPQPGYLVQLHGDGTQKRIWTPEDMAIPEPFEKDAGLMRLLGADAEGRLWFDLASPVNVQPEAARPSPDPAKNPEVPDETQESAPARVPEDASLMAYASKGLERIYIWNPGDRTLRRLEWKDLPGALKPPPEVGASAMPRIRPESGGILFQANRSAWWIPLSSLPSGKGVAAIADDPSR